MTAGDEDEFEEELEDEAPSSSDASAWPGAEPKQAAFLTALVFHGGQHGKAARAAQIARATHYRWLDFSEPYPALYKRAMEQVTAVLEDEAIRRAKDGTTKGIYFKGEKVATERLYSDGLMMFLLRGAAPDKYRERTEHTGKDGGPIESKIEVVFVRPKE